MKVGDRFNCEFLVDSQVYDGFLTSFGDRNPLHIDDDFARSKGFDRRVMHGNILSGFLSYFVGMILPTKDVIISSQTMKFIKPVYLNDRLNFEAAIADVFESVGVVEIGFSFSCPSRGVKVASGKVQICIR